MLTCNMTLWIVSPNNYVECRAFFASRFLVHVPYIHVIDCRRFDRLLRDVTICLVGKYTRLQDSYASVIKALSHAAMACNYKLDLKVCLLAGSFLMSVMLLTVCLVCF